MPFPATRLRRLRQNPTFRRLVRETTISVDDLVLPLFIVPGRGIRKEMESLPGNYHLSVDCLVEEARELRDLGISAILLFGVPDAKDKNERAFGAYSPTGLVQQAVRAVKENVPGLLVITDVCLCEYTPHGHCGVLEERLPR